MFMLTKEYIQRQKGVATHLVSLWQPPGERVDREFVLAMGSNNSLNGCWNWRAYLQERRMAPINFVLCVITKNELDFFELQSKAVSELLSLARDINFLANVQYLFADFGGKFTLYCKQ